MKLAVRKLKQKLWRSYEYIKITYAELRSKELN